MGDGSNKVDSVYIDNAAEAHLLALRPRRVAGHDDGRTRTIELDLEPRVVDRLAKIGRYLKLDPHVHDSGELDRPDLNKLEVALRDDASISHVVVVHCETTTGMLNPIKEIGQLAKAAGKVRMVGKDYVMADGDVVEFRFNV